MGESTVDENWLYGHLLDNPSSRGIFPITHVVKICISPESLKANKPNPALSLQSTQTSGETRQAKSVRAFNLINPQFDFLNFEQGEYLVVKSIVDSNWLRGEKKTGESGIFPAKCIEYLETDQNLAIENVPEPKLKSPQKFCYVIYDFQAENPSELSCKNGQQLRVIFDGFNDGWVKLENSSGQTGLVPLNFISYEDLEKKSEISSNNKLPNKTFSTHRNKERTFSSFSDINQIDLKTPQSEEINSPSPFLVKKPVLEPKDRSSSMSNLVFKQENRVNELSRFFEAQKKIEPKEITIKRHDTLEKKLSYRPPIPPKPVKKASWEESNVLPRPGNSTFWLTQNLLINFKLVNI